MSTYPVKIKSPSGRLIGWTILQDTAMNLYPDEPTDKTIAMLEYNKIVGKDAFDAFDEERVKEAMKEEFKHFREDYGYSKERLVEYYKGHFKERWKEAFGEALPEEEVRELIPEKGE